MAGNINSFGSNLYPKSKNTIQSIPFGVESSALEDNPMSSWDLSSTVNFQPTTNSEAASYYPTAKTTGSQMVLPGIQFQARPETDEGKNATQVDIRSSLQLAGDYKALIAQRISMGSELGIIHKNPAAQISLLMKAFGDCECFINNLLADFAGVNIPPEVRSMIASFRALEASVMSQIKMVTGLTLNDNEMRALLEQDAGKLKQNISINSLVQEDASKIPQDQKPVQKNTPEKAAQDESIYGVHANPAKLEALLASGDQKASKDLDRIVQQASAMLDTMEQNPQLNMGSLQKVLALINRGNLMSAVMQGLGQLKGGGSKFSAAQSKLDQVSQRLANILAKAGLPKELIVKPAPLQLAQ